ncbi:MAG: hypothetical protein GXO65_01130, partial [Euryarchaeota archaeon]|nr:hypothetical protein [Euryarchaeota archaeon]
MTANGSDSVSEVTTAIDLSGFLAAGGRITRGQGEYYEDVLKAEYYPGCTSRRTWTPVYRNYSLELISPVVENQTTFLIPVVTRFRDAYGWNQRNLTINITVTPAVKACRRVTVEKKDIEVAIDYADEVSLERAGDFKIKVKNTGYTPISNATLILHLPNNIEMGTNDSRWLGKIIYQVRRANDTLYVYSGDMEVNESIDVRETREFPLLISGTKAGDYIIRYEV